MNLDLSHISAIAELAGIEIPEGDLAQLQVVMRNQLAMAEMLRPLDYGDVPPIVTLDPRWH